LLSPINNEGLDERQKIMGQEILVALKSEDRLSQMIPYIEKVAQPGMRVVLLVGFITHFDSNHSNELQDPEATACKEGESKQAQFAASNTSGTPLMEQQKLLSEHKVFMALEALGKRGIEITVDVYTGSLRRAVKSYTSKGDVHLIVMRANPKRTIIEFLEKAGSVFGLLKQPTFSPVLVFHPTHAA
jgi:hypothetical protein